MASSDKIKSKDIIEDGVFDNATKSAEGLLVVVKELETGFKAIISETNDFLKSNKKTKVTVDTFEQLSKKATESKQAIEGLTQAQKQKIKLEEKLISTTKEEATALEEVRLKLSEQRKAAKELAKENLGLNSSYQKLAKRLNDNRKVLKNLAAEGKQNTKEFKSLQKEVSKLDKELKDIDASAGQFQRNVGNYPETLKKAGDSLKTFAVGAVAAKLSLEGLSEVVESNEESSGAFAGVTGALKGGLSAVTSSIGGFAAALFDGDSITEAYNKNLDGLVDKTKQAGVAGKEAAEAQIDFTKALRPLSVEISRLTTEIDKQNSIAGDSTRSFNEIQLAVEKSTELEVKRAAIQAKIAKEQLSIIDSQIEARGEGANVQDLLNERNERAIELQEALGNLAVTELENEKEIRQIKQDRLERDLDILIDGFDNQKTINERKIADERASFEARQKIQDETVRLADESFKAQKDVLAELSKAGIDVDELLTLDATELQKRIRSLEQSEIIEGRTLEVVRERRVVIQDLADSQKDLNDAQLESIKNIEASQQAVEQDDLALRIEQLEAIEEQTISIIDNSIELQKEALTDQAIFEKKLAEKEIFDAEELAEKKLEIEELLANNIERLDIESAEKKKAIRDAEKEEIIETSKELASLIISETNNELDKVFQLRNERNDQDISDQEEALSKQEQRAIDGQSNTLAFQEQALKESNLKKNEELKKQQKIEEAIKLAEIYLEAYLNALGDPNTNPAQAGAEAFGTTLLAKGISQGIASSFFEGTEDTGTVSNPLDNNGGRVAILHNNERVLTAKQNTKIGGISNDEVADIVYNYKKVMNPFTMSPEFKNKNTTKKSDTYLVVNRLESLEKAIMGKPVPSYEFDKLGYFIRTEVDKGIRKQTIKRLS